MKKVSLLAASVALALVGCGGSDGGSDTNTGTPSAGGIVITGFDGYFNNAVVFLDSNIGTKGQLDESDTVLGLTDINGQIKLPKDTDLSTGTIALQTLKPGDVVKLGLGDRIAATTNKADFASDFADTYTTDMDLPGQPMEHSVVFRSQQVGDNIVISPITDLVALQAPVVLRTDATAEQNVCNSLFGENTVTGEECTTKLYSDFTKSDPVLHKTAQILTETKATAVGDNYTNKINTIAKVAMETAETLNTEENKDKLGDPTYKPVIDTTVSNDDIVKPTNTTYKTLVNEAKYNEIKDSLDKLNLEQATSPKEATSLLTISIADLFSDKDINSNDILVIADITSIPKGMTFEIIKNDLVISGTSTEAGNFSLVLQPKAEQEKVDSTVTARFSFDVKAEADAVKPSIDTDYLAEVKGTLANLDLIVGQSFTMPEGTVLSADGLFNETVKTIELSSNANVIGLTIKLDEYQKNIIISGRPTSTAETGEYYIQLRATADNGLSSEVVKLDLPAIVEGMISVNQNEVTLLQDQINNLDLTVGDLIDHETLDLDITPLFTSNVDGEVEYYAGLEFDKKQKNNHEYYTTIPGVRVHTDEVNGLGTLTILGAPKEATKGGYFYVAAGINPDAENEIVSKMVKITLPDVKPADETLPPVEPGLGFTEAHFNTGKVWKMGSFANKDGEIGHAMLLSTGQSLQFCWGSQDGADQQYSSNISRWEQSAYTTLTQLDELPNYADYAQRDCWDVQLKDGKIYDSEVENEIYEYEMLYQNKTANGDYQIIVKLDGDELFWMDSTDAPFAQSLSVSDKVADGRIEFDMTVESETVADESTKLYYAAGKFEYANAAYEYTSIMPEGFYTPGELEIDETGEHEMLILKETGEQSDYKTRYRYVNHNFGDFYIGINSSKDSGGTSSPEFGLYSYSQDAMEKVVSKLPLLQN